MLKQLKISILSTNFKVDEENKTIKCAIHARVRFKDDYVTHVESTTKCVDTDEFDVIQGKRIAESKAKIALYRKVMVENENTIVALQKLTNSLVKTFSSITKYERAEMKEFEHLKSLTKREEDNEKLKD